MNSIDKNQPERNREDLSSADAVGKIRELVKAGSVCFFCTHSIRDNAEAARPMSVSKIDDAGHLWFFSASDSHKNEELNRDPSCTLYFQGSPHSDFLQLNGTVTITRDRAKIDQLWEPIIGNWFTGGKDDPRITVLEVTPTDGYYWDTKHGNTVAGIKMLIGSLLGKTLDDSIHGKLKV